MTFRSTVLIRASLPAFALIMASPALAQDNEYSLPGESAVLASAAQGTVSVPAIPVPPSLPSSPMPAMNTAPAPYAASSAYQGDPRAREAWLAECRNRTADYYGGGRNNGGIIGALVGGLAGGIIGNRIDDGPDRAGGTIGGAVLGGVVGAVAGNAIGKASRRSRSGDYDYCEAYFEDYYRHYSQTQYAPAPAYYAPVAPRRATAPCTEEVVEEYVPVRSRVIRRATPVRPSKRIRDKRIRLY